jgi:hypothetical protein
MINQNPLGGGDSQALGGIANYQLMAQNDNVSFGGGTGPWSKTWEARRSCYEFYGTRGQNHMIALLSDVQLLPYYRLSTGWNSGPSGSWARWDMVRAAHVIGVDSMGNPMTNEHPDPFGPALGQEVRFGFMALVLDTLPYTTKAGKHYPWRVRYALVTNREMMDQFQAYSSMKQRDLLGSIWNISRGQDSKAPKIGNWMPLRYHGEDRNPPVRFDTQAALVADLEAMLAPAEKTLSQTLAEIDLNQFYPAYEPDEARAILNLHRRVVLEHPGVKGLSFNAAAMDQICGPARAAGSAPMPMQGFPSAVPAVGQPLGAGVPAGAPLFGQPQQQTPMVNPLGGQPQQAPQANPLGMPLTGQPQQQQAHPGALPFRPATQAAANLDPLAGGSAPDQQFAQQPATLAAPAGYVSTSGTGLGSLEPLQPPPAATPPQAVELPQAGQGSADDDDPLGSNPFGQGAGPAPA